MSVMIPNPPLNVPLWQWFRVDRDTQIRWVALGHTMSDDAPGIGLPSEMSQKTPAQIAAATMTVDAYNALFAPQYVAGEIPAYIGPVIVSPPPPPPPVVSPPPPPTTTRLLDRVLATQMMAEQMITDLGKLHAQLAEIVQMLRRAL